MRRHVTNLQSHLLRVGAAAVLTLGVGVGQASAAYVGGAVDLTTANATETVTADLGGDFIVYQIDPQSTGTGVIDSFLRVQDNGTANGYNTDATGVFDNLAGNFTHSLLLSDVPIVTVGSTTYYEFSLDINQAGSQTATLLSLNQLQFFTASGDPGATNTIDLSSSTQLLTLGSGGTTATEVFRLSNLANPYDLQLNYDLNAGSGSGDYRFLIATSLFGSATNVILYSQFGLPSGAYIENDGFEEWFVRTGVTSGPGDITATPEPASLLLLATGMGFVARRVRRRKTVA